MDTIRMMVTGSPAAAQFVLASMEEVEGVTRVEEMVDLLPHLDDADSSSAGLTSDGLQKVHTLEVDVSGPDVARRVQFVAEQAAMAEGAVLEVDREDG
jgi:hypothetical protein